MKNKKILNNNVPSNWEEEPGKQEEVKAFFKQKLKERIQTVIEKNKLCNPSEKSKESYSISNYGEILGCELFQKIKSVLNFMTSANKNGGFLHALKGRKENKFEYTHSELHGVSLDFEKRMQEFITPRIQQKLAKFTEKELSTIVRAYQSLSDNEKPALLLSNFLIRYKHYSKEKNQQVNSVFTEKHEISDMPEDTEGYT